MEKFSQFYWDLFIEKKSCLCSKLGKQFIVHGRAEESEIRGCSDV